MEWIDQELSAYQTAESTANVAFLKFEDNKIVTLEIDFSNKFEKKTDKFDELKAWIPVKHDNESKIWTLNTANPFYRTILEQGKQGKNLLKIIKTGKGQDTRYNIVE